MIKAIIFDCFGVLYPDTYWTMARKHLGNDLSGKKDQLHDLVHQVDLGIITRDGLWTHFGELVGQTKEEVYAELEQFNGLDEGLLSLIEELKSTHKTGMISNVGHGFIERMFVQKPVEYYFDSVVLSSEVGMVKPDRRIYELTANQLGYATEECVFIDDLEKNVRGAEDAGMYAIHYQDFESFKLQLDEHLKMSDSDK